jgi:hypothetical protein
MTTLYAVVGNGSIPCHHAPCQLLHATQREEILRERGNLGSNFSCVGWQGMGGGVNSNDPSKKQGLLFLLQGINCDVYDLYYRYHGSQAVVISALQVAKHPIAAPGPSSVFTPPAFRHATLPGLCIAYPSTFSWQQSFLPVARLEKFFLGEPTLIKKKIKFSSYIRKFRREMLQSHI